MKDLGSHGEVVAILSLEAGAGKTKTALNYLTEHAATFNLEPEHVQVFHISQEVSFPDDLGVDKGQISGQGWSVVAVDNIAKVVSHLQHSNNDCVAVLLNGIHADRVNYWADGLGRMWSRLDAIRQQLVKNAERIGVQPLLVITARETDDGLTGNPAAIAAMAYANKRVTVGRNLPRTFLAPKPSI